MRSFAVHCAVVVALTSASPGAGRVIITEIMYNPDSNEGRAETEWVEIANVGDEAVEISNWRLDDEDRAEWGPFSCTLAPGGVAVLVNADAVDEKAFRAAWDPKASATPSAADASSDEAGAGDESDPEPDKPGWLVIPVKWASLANSPSAENEHLKLLDADDKVICAVNIEEGDPWPTCRPDGPSIYLVDLKATDLNQGALWKRSELDVHGARAVRKTEIFDGEDIGSPGFVEGLTARGVSVAHSEKTSDDSKKKKTESDDDTIDY
jgi:hypothetical protein